MACFDAGYRNKVLCVLSAAGNERTISRLRAVLQSNANVQFRCMDFPSPFNPYSYAPLRCEAGYTIHKSKLDYDQWHMLAIAKYPGLLPVVSDESLWQELRSERHTTPLLRSWVPWLKEQMLEESYLDKCECFQCEAGCVSIDHGGLDDLVTEGIKSGNLRVE